MAGPIATSELPTCLPGFLDPDECRAIVAEIDASRQEQAEIWLGHDFGVHPDSRLGSVTTLRPKREAAVQRRLWQVMAQLEARYGCAVTHLSAISALIYRRGDHFAAHSDGGIDDEDESSEACQRRVSLVVTLNDGESPRPDFSGGELQFFPGCLAGTSPQLGDHVVVCSRPGLLVAFPSPMVHRVSPVLAGCRYSLAVWALEIAG